MIKNCSLSEWREFHRINQVKKHMNDTFSRVRGRLNRAIIIVQRGAWSKNNIFSRCEKCDGLKLYGVCYNDE